MLQPGFEPRTLRKVLFVEAADQRLRVLVSRVRWTIAAGLNKDRQNGSVNSGVYLQGSFR